MEIIASHGFILLALACCFGLFMAWGIGANDVANAMGTSVGSRALTLKQAILVAAIFEFAGAYLAGGEVTSTIRKGIIDPESLSGSPELLVFGMLSALLAAATWLLIASIRGWPVSTTHSIVGAIVGFAAVGISVEAVAWGKVGTIAASWIVSPLLAGSMSFALFISVKNLILDHEDTFARARTYVPIYMWMVGFMISMVTLLKGLKHIGIDFDLVETKLNWLGNVHLLKYINIKGIKFIFLKILNSVFSFMANLNPFFCSRIWAYWFGGFDEIEFKFKCVK